MWFLCWCVRLWKFQNLNWLKKWEEFNVTDKNRKIISSGIKWLYTKPLIDKKYRILEHDTSIIFASLLPILDFAYLILVSYFSHIWTI
jgi:hypothetical protein